MIMLNRCSEKIFNPSCYTGLFRIKPYQYLYSCLTVNRRRIHTIIKKNCQCKHRALEK